MLLLSRKLNAAIAAITISTTIFFACSGNDKASGKTEETTATTEKKETTSSNVTDACSLITEDEAKAVLGNAVTKGMSTSSMCQYLSASEEISKAGESVSIQLHPGAASEFDTYVSSAEKDLNVKTKPVTGIGDKAVFAEGQLIVSKGNDFIIVIVGKKMNEEEQIVAEKNIAQTACERMGK